MTTLLWRAYACAYGQQRLLPLMLFLSLFFAVNAQTTYRSCSDIDTAGADIQVNGVTGVPGITSVSSCQSLCASLSGCVGGTYFAYVSICYPKGMAMIYLPSSSIVSTEGATLFFPAEYATCPQVPLSIQAAGPMAALVTMYVDPSVSGIPGNCPGPSAYPFAFTVHSGVAKFVNTYPYGNSYPNPPGALTITVDCKPDLSWTAVIVADVGGTSQTTTLTVSGSSGAECVNLPNFPANALGMMTVKCRSSLLPSMTVTPQVTVGNNFGVCFGDERYQWTATNGLEQAVDNYSWGATASYTLDATAYCLEDLSWNVMIKVNVPATNAPGNYYQKGAAGANGECVPVNDPTFLVRGVKVNCVRAS